MYPASVQVWTRSFRLVDLHRNQSLAGIHQ